MIIPIKSLVKGALFGESGYIKIASTYEPPVVSNTLEDKHGQNWLSPNFASLFAFRTENAKSLSVIHIQGQHNGVQGRMYDTRIFYNIEAEGIRKIDSKHGAIIGSLPKMEKYNEKRIGSLKPELQVKEISGYDNNKIDNLCEYILQAIIESKYLLIKLDESSNWKENNIFENIVSKSFFAAIDKLPEILRPVVSFAMSVDDKYNKEFLEDLLVILYHGNNNFDFKSTIEIDWKDLNNKAKTNYLAQTRYFSELVLIILKGKIDFYDTNFTSNDMALGIYDVNKIIKNKMSISDCNTEDERRVLISRREVQLVNGTIQEKINALKDLLKTHYYSDTNRKNLIEKLPQDLIFHSEIKPFIEKLMIEDLKSKAEKGSLDLSDIYVLYKYLQREVIAKNYADIYFDLKILSLKITQQIEEIQITISQISDKLLCLALENKITENILQTFTVTDWNKVAEFLVKKEHKQIFKNKTIEYNLSFFDLILKANKNIDLAKECLYNSKVYTLNFDELCKMPFIEHLKPDKIKELREKNLTRFNEFDDLYNNISINEIIGLLKINNNEKTIFKLVNAKKLTREFVNQKKDICEQELKNAIYFPDIKHSEIYKLYKNADIPFNKPEIELELSTLKTVFENAKVLNFNLRSEIAILYKFNSNVTAWQKIHEITKQKQTVEKIDKKIDSEKELDACIYLKKEGFNLPEIYLDKLINNIQKRNDKNLEIEKLLSNLKCLGIPLTEYKEIIISKMSSENKKNKQLIERYFGNEQGINPKETKMENIPRILKDGWRFVKNHKETAYISISLILLIVGFISGYKRGESDAINVLSNRATKTHVQDTIIKIKKNDSVSIFLRKQITNDFYGKNDLIKAYSKAEWFSIYKAKPLIVDSIILNNSIYHLNFKIDGPESGTKFYQKIDSLATKFK